MTNRPHKPERGDDQSEMIDQLMNEFCQRMMRYGCDSVQVMASVHKEKEGVTSSRTCGYGNWYARKGLVQEFIESDQARTASFIEHTEFQIPDDEDIGGADE